MSDVSKKECKNCKKVKSFEAFHKNSKGKYGLLSSCKICQRSKVNNFRRTEKGRHSRKIERQSIAHKRGKLRYSRSQKGIYSSRKRQIKYRDSGRFIYTDGYFRALLVRQLGLSVQDISKDMVELKRTIVFSKRVIRSFENNE